MEIKNLAAALVKAKKSFRPALKDKTNPHFRSQYADLGNCIDAVDDALLANGIFMYQETFENETGVSVETVLMHESGDVLRCGKLYLPASKLDAQGYGSALSYARRYSLMAACGIAPEDDDGNAASKKSEPVEKTLAQSVLSDLLASISETASLEDLKNAYTKAITVAGSDKGAVSAIIKAKDSRKAQLTEKVAA